MGSGREKVFYFPFTQWSVALEANQPQILSCPLSFPISQIMKDRTDGTSRDTRGQHLRDSHSGWEIATSLFPL